MEKKRKSYNEEFRREAIRHLEETGKPLTQLAAELDVGVTTLSNWKQLYSKKQKKEQMQPLVDYERLQQLERANRELQEENEILKKAMHFFTKSP